MKNSSSWLEEIQTWVSTPEEQIKIKEMLKKSEDLYRKQKESEHIDPLDIYKPYNI